MGSAPPREPLLQDHGVTGKPEAYNIEPVKLGRILCWVLVAVDVFLGGTATFFPNFYAALIHPELTSPPVDYIVRTGILWLVFLLFQLRAATADQPAKWFFLVGLVRLMEVPADILYAILAIGATPFSRLMILVAPVANSICGSILLKLARDLEKASAQ